jgi:hypothetical protein
VFRKLGVTSRTQLARRVVNDGIPASQPIPAFERPAHNGHR